MDMKLMANSFQEASFLLKNTFSRAVKKLVVAMHATPTETFEACMLE